MTAVVRAARLIAYLTTAALVGDALATVVSGAFVRGAGGSRPEIASAGVVTTERSTTEALPEHFRPILERNLFGASPEPIDPIPACDMGVATTSPLTERYELDGTVVAANATESRAVIRSRVGDGGARTVLTGSPLDEARVVRIERRRILVDASGELGELDFDLDTGDESATEPGAPLTASPAPSSAPGAPVSRAGDGAYEIDGETFRRISADPAALMRDARFVPDTVRTGAGGWRVFALKPGSLFAQLGLVDGDVLRAIGSTRLAGLDATLAGLTELRDAHAFEVTLERGQIERTLRYRVR